MQGKQPSQEALLAFVVQVHSLKNLIHVSLTQWGEKILYVTEKSETEIWSAFNQSQDGWL